jgi:transcription initiation factor IIE alpha subunit
MDTREQNFRDYNTSGARNTIKDQVFNIIDRHVDITDMEISSILGLERNFITRARTDLVNDGRVKFSRDRTCHVTGKFVKSYCVGFEEKENILSHCEMEKIRDKLQKANIHQKNIIKGWCS